MVLEINGMKWHVEECNGDEIPLSDGMFFGRTFYFDRKIFINKTLSITQKEQTLRHELTHAYLFETQIISQEKDFSYTEEMLCEFIGKYGDKIARDCKTYFQEGLNNATVKG